MAEETVFVIVVEVHTVALAVLPHLASGALTPHHPCVVAEPLESVLPHIPEVILIYTAMREVCAHACAAQDIAIDTY